MFRQRQTPYESIQCLPLESDERRRQGRAGNVEAGSYLTRYLRGTLPRDAVLTDSTGVDTDDVYTVITAVNEFCRDRRVSGKRHGLTDYATE